MGKLQVVVGGAYGSEGKGAVAAYLAAREKRQGRANLAIRVAGPNAGHTVWGDVCDPEHPDFGHPVEFKLRQLPVAAVSDPRATLAIAAGSEVDPQVLKDEIATLELAGYTVEDRLVIDQSATVLEERHVWQEQQHNLTAKLGSTAKGIGAARAERVMRDANLWGGSFDVADLASVELGLGSTVLIEGTQGYGLGLHTENYPFVTSSDCRAIDFLSMAGISPWADYVSELEVWVVFRTRPIRVAGNSGPLKGETDWDTLGLPIERTTVTNKVRRVGDWDPQLAARAVAANGGDKVLGALTMLDQVFPEVQGWTADDWFGRTERGKAFDDREVRKYVAAREEEAGCSFVLLGTSPTTLIDRRDHQNDF